MQSFEAKKVIEQKKKQLWLIKRFYLPIYGILSVSLFVTLLLFASSLLGTWNIEVKDTNWFVVFFGVAGGFIIGRIMIKPFYYWYKKVIILENEIRDIFFWIK